MIKVLINVLYGKEVCALSYKNVTSIKLFRDNLYIYRQYAKPVKIPKLNIVDYFFYY